MRVLALILCTVLFSYSSTDTLKVVGFVDSTLIPDRSYTVCLSTDTRYVIISEEYIALRGFDSKNKPAGCSYSLQQQEWGKLDNSTYLKAILIIDGNTYKVRYEILRSLTIQSVDESRTRVYYLEPYYEE